MTKTSNKKATPEKAAAHDPPVIFSRKTPHKSADIYREMMRPTLIRFQHQWYAWDQLGAYRDVEDETIAAEIGALAIKAKVRTTKKKKITDGDGNPQTVDEEALAPFNPTPRDIKAIYDMLAQACHRPFDTMSPPVFLDGGAGVYAGLNPHNLISCRNGIVDITTGKKYPPTPTFFTLTALPLDYDPSAPVPRKWLRFLLQVMKGRKPLIRALQEMIGYIVSDDTSMQVVFFLWGRSRSGKGTILRVMTKLNGPLNTHHPSIHTLAGRFGLEGCIGKSMIQITDMDCDSTEALSNAASKINAISGEDGVTVERKGIGDWNGTLPGRIVMVGNNLPNFRSHSAAMAARLLIFPFDVSFLNREDRQLTDKLTTELAGILIWALAGLRRLRSRGRFEEHKDMADAKRRMLYASDPLRAFIEERAIVEAKAKVHKAVLYASYQSYCDTVGAHPLPLHTFGERLPQAFPSIAPSKRTRKLSEPRGKQVPIFSGVGLNDEEQLKTYKIDLEMLALGFRTNEPEALARDEDGWPIPCSRVADFDE
jgi:putative DNA primase/helicase